MHWRNTLAITTSHKDSNKQVGDEEEDKEKKTTKTTTTTATTKCRCGSRPLL